MSLVSARISSRLNLKSDFEICRTYLCKKKKNLLKLFDQTDVNSKQIHSLLQGLTNCMCVRHV